MTENNRTLEECSSCRHWRENLPVQLCQFGKCHLTDNPVEKERTDFCDNHKAIEEEL